MFCASLLVKPYDINIGVEVFTYNGSNFESVKDSTPDGCIPSYLSIKRLKTGIGEDVAIFWTINDSPRLQGNEAYWSGHII